MSIVSATVLTPSVPSSEALIVLPARVVSRIDLAMKVFLWSRRCFQQPDHPLQVTLGDTVFLVKPVSVPVTVRLLEFVVDAVAGRSAYP